MKIRDSAAEYNNINLLKALAEKAFVLFGIIQSLKFIYVNPYISKITGYTKKELLEMNISKLIHPQYRKKFMERARKGQAGEPVEHNYEFSILSKNGKEIWLDFSAQKIIFKGRPAIIGIGIDRTRRKQLENDLKKSEERLRYMIQSAPAGIVEFDLINKKFLTINDFACSLSGYSREELLSMDIRKLFTKSGWERIEKELEMIISRKRVPLSTIYRIITKKNKKIWVKVKIALNFKNDKPISSLVIIQDATGQIKKEHKQDEMRKKLEFLSTAATKLLETMSLDDIFHFTAKQLHQISNEAVISISEFDLINRGLKIKDLVGPQRKLKLIRQVLEKNLVEIRDPEEVLKRTSSDGLTIIKGGLFELLFGKVSETEAEKLEEKLQLGPIYAMRFFISEDCIGIVTVLTDKNTEFKDFDLIKSIVNQAGLALKRNRSDKAVFESRERLRTFLAILGHELRNPLAPIVSNLELLKLKQIEDPEIREFLEIIDRQTNQIAKLLQDLLDASRIERGKITLHIEPVNASDAIKHAAEMVEPLIKAAGQKLNLSIKNGIILAADQLRIEQILANLLNNASKYSPAGSEIFLKAESDDRSGYIKIIDKGIGIEKKIMPKIFEPFTQEYQEASLKKGGLGIGLFLSRELARLHKGNLRADSKGINQGSEFTLEIPLWEKDNARN